MDYGWIRMKSQLNAQVNALTTKQTLLNSLLRKEFYTLIQT